MGEPTEISPGFEAVTPKDRAEHIARIIHVPITVEFRFPLGDFKKPEDMVGHYVRIESDRVEPGEYFANSVDERGRVVLEPCRLDSTYAWDDTPIT